MFLKDEIAMTQPKRQRGIPCLPVLFSHFNCAVRSGDRCNPIPAPPRILATPDEMTENQKGTVPPGGRANFPFSTAGKPLRPENQGFSGAANAS